MAVDETVIEGDPVFIEQEVQRNSRAAAGAPNGRAAGRDVARREFAIKAAHVVLVQHRQFVQIRGRADIPRLQPALVKDAAVVRHALIGVLDEFLQLPVLIGPEAVGRPELALPQHRLVASRQAAGALQLSPEPVGRDQQMLRHDLTAAIGAGNERVIVNHLLPA